MTRIVQLEFDEAKIEEFISFFDTINDKVNNFPGCKGMKLYQDIKKPSIVLTYSHWDDESDLENYRNSETFKSIWSKIKPWFCEKPQAWSLNSHFNGFEVSK
ncbi:MAG: antibiotic biosynthesis monooxygenase [Crocinitomicaceae bacterium]|nr:antibiotic biosynthesis monooxygenase [Crocinitomicaceae bacterium]MDG1657425.1 antibiotic biosynthesis monooxygenase [Crocinitomicaceae bacterium]MDG2441406.1 antibiotic biosynthesis monooxygenase [Crocinitomicaceae bacterium]|tara:strand:- start:11734 stop:12039 length:306 start_codon:yes stop_codon:yes gene_type:complete